MNMTYPKAPYGFGEVRSRAAFKRGTVGKPQHGVAWVRRFDGGSQKKT